LKQQANATDVSRGIFGATTGLDRTLKMLKRHQITATFFIPGHTLESFPKQCEKVRDAGHEIGLHGYTHEFVSDLSEEQELAVLQKSMKILEDFTGKRPRGWTAPAWTTSPSTVKLLEENGIVYDHSFMHHDCQPYYLPYQPEYIETDVSKKAEEWMKPMSQIKSSSVIEIPANWHLDDWPPLNIGMGVGSGFIDPDVVLKIWKAQFDFYYREYDTFIFPISIHPQVTGKAHVQEMQEKFISYINSHEGVEWVTMGSMADKFREGAIEGYKFD
jgi:peptidoglycan/xylan/chitin deacetylase (PgdA/CDA1 family)